MSRCRLELADYGSVGRLVCSPAARWRGCSAAGAPKTAAARPMGKARLTPFPPRALEEPGRLENRGVNLAARAAAPAPPGGWSPTRARAVRVVPVERPRVSAERARPVL